MIKSHVAPISQNDMVVQIRHVSFHTIRICRTRSWWSKWAALVRRSICASSRSRVAICLKSSSTYSTRASLLGWSLTTNRLTRQGHRLVNFVLQVTIGLSLRRVWLGLGLGLGLTRTRTSCLLNNKFIICIVHPFRFTIRVRLPSFLFLGSINLVWRWPLTFISYALPYS